jgi:hypothetical protein
MLSNSSEMLANSGEMLANSGEMLATDNVGVLAQVRIKSLGTR